MKDDSRNQQHGNSQEQAQQVPPNEEKIPMEIPEKQNPDVNTEPVKGGDKPQPEIDDPHIHEIQPVTANNDVASDYGAGDGQTQTNGAIGF